MVGRSAWGIWAVGLLVVAGCDAPEPRVERIEVASAHRACEEGDACGVVETSCTSQGCKCGVAVNEAHLLDYQKALAECRGQGEIESCEALCETPFAKCFNGVCVLTEEPAEMFRRGRSVQKACERTRGTYVGCPDCPPNARCKSCLPCECPSTHRWTKKGCSAVVRTEARDIRIETRPSRANLGEKVKARVHNESRRTIWLKSVCGTPFHRVRKKQDAWERGYEPFHRKKCKEGAIELDPGESRPFVVGNLASFEDPSGEAVSPGTFRFELTYTDGTKSFRHSGTVYSTSFDLVTKVSSR